MRPSWAVTNAPVIRNVANATIQKTNTDGPANWSPAALLMNRTIATKITTRSNGPRVRATRTGATFSEIMAFSSGRAAMLHPSRREGEHARNRCGRALTSRRWDNPCTGGSCPQARLSDEIQPKPLRPNETALEEPARSRLRLGDVRWVGAVAAE